MSFGREGLVFIVIAALIAAGTYALALNRRSWPLWLLAFLLTVIALWVAYFFRDPERTDERSAQVVIAPADGYLQYHPGKFLYGAAETSSTPVVGELAPR
ncbi:MAG: hypothetical protein ABI664_20265 [bacterium]